MNHIADDGRAGLSSMAIARLTRGAVLCLVVFSAAFADAQTQPIATMGLGAGWATFGQAVPQGLARDGLQVGNLVTQTDVKNRWPDGTIRFAIVTTRVPSAGMFGVTPASASTGAFSPSWPDASVALVINGITYSAVLPRSLPEDAWLSGPLVYEGRLVLAPISEASGAAHPFLRVNFDTRAYHDGDGRLDVSVENVLDSADATTVTYDVTIRIGGQAIFSKNSVEHYYLTRWRKVIAIGSTRLAAITPDMTPFYASRALPLYLSQVGNVVSTPAGPNYDLLQGGALRPNMQDEGNRPELAPYPDWTARYLVHRDVTQRSFVLANGDLSGSWPIHVREAETGGASGVGAERLVSIEQRPAIWLGERAQGAAWDKVQGAPLPMRAPGITAPGPGQSELIPDNAHQPSIAYVPYLMTGDRYYAEEMAFWANYAMVRTDPGDGVRGSLGILANNEVRGYGWALRNLVDAASYYPDASPVKAYLSRKLISNLQWLNAYAAAQNPNINPFQVLWINKRSEGGQYIALWEQSYLAHAIDRANQQGFAGGLAHRDAIARLQLRLFASEPAYPREHGAPSLVAVGTPNASDPATLATFHTTMSQIWSGTIGQELPFAGFYGAEARLNLLHGVQSAWPGAEEAHAYLWPFISADLAQRAGWALGAPPNESAGNGLEAGGPQQIVEAGQGLVVTQPAAAIPSTLPEGIPDFSADLTRPIAASVQSGDWSSAATWAGGQIPTLNHVVRVVVGHTVTITDTTAAAYTIAVDGTLAFAPDVTTRLTVTNLVVMAGSNGMGAAGILQVGTVLSPIASSVIAEIVIADSLLGGSVPDPEQFGTGIIVFGKVSMHGSVRTPTFVRLATEPRVGNITLTLSEAVSGWRAGDRLVLPDTRHIKETETVPGGWTNTVNQWEERILQSVSADGLTLTLTTALQYDHLGARNLNGVLEFLPHVGNLTRNVIVRSANPSGTRGHVIVTHMADVDIRYALYKDLGRTTYLPLDALTNHIGRYPLHVHHLSGPLPTPANTFQFTLLGNAVDGGSVETRFKWGIAVHGSHYGLIQDNVIYNLNGAAVATEDGSESFNVFDHNFALRGMGQPNDVLGEARMAMGTEAVGFWFRGPNNYVRNNVAANFQNPVTEAAYGFVYQFRFLGNIEVPNFKGANTMGTMGLGQSTTMNGNNLPLLQFENNEAYGAMQGGFTYWWISSQDPQPFPGALESVVKDLKIWNVYNKGVYAYPGQKVTFDGLKVRGSYTAASRCCGDGVYFADYMAKDVVIRNSDIQGMQRGIIAPESGFGPAPNLIVKDTYLRNWDNVLVPTVGSVNGCWMDDKLVVLDNTRFDAAPGRPANHILMVRDVAFAPECLAKLDQVRVYAYNGIASENFEVYHPNPLVLPRPPVACTQTARPGINGPTCAIAPLTIVPTASLNALPLSVVEGQSSALTWTTTDAITVSIDQGIGTVAATGTVTVSPSATTTYTLTANGGNGAAIAAATITVRLKPLILWNPPATLTYGASLGATQLNATTTVPGTFVYTPAAGTILSAGIGRILSVTFTPTDLANYTTAVATVPITVLKATPVIAWTPPGSIVAGTALGAVQLNATVVGPPGSLAYTPATGIVLPVGPAQRLSVTFTPADTANYMTVTAAVPITVVAAGAAPSAPIKIGNLIAGTFSDATGHSGQSHLVYAPNAGVWWLFTLSSAHDSLGDRTVQSYVSSGPDLAIATWTAKTVSPTLGNANFATSSLLAGGRSLGVALRSIGGIDYVHVFASAAFDGQASSNGHVRAQLGPTSIAWGTWNNPGSPNTASEWQGPANSGNPPSAASTHPSWGNSIGISSGGYIHHFSVTMDQEVDCNVGRSTNADVSATWTNGFGNNVNPTGFNGTSPPWTTAVIDKTMIFECKALAFAPLASDEMLAVYTNGAVAQPNMTNLRFQRSGAAGTWTNIRNNNGGGNGNVFSTTANINQNDWALVPVSTTKIYAFRRNIAGTLISGASYPGPTTNPWPAMSSALAPPAFGAGQAMKIGASSSVVSGGLFGATDGTNVWLFVINNDTANSILYAKFNGAAWTPWSTVPGTGSGTQTRNFIAGYPTASGGQIGLVWTQGTTNFDVMATALKTGGGGGPSPSATLTEPLPGSTTSGGVAVSATATPVSGTTIAGVQFVLDGLPLGAEDTTSPYSITWDTTAGANGPRFLSAIARDTNGGTGAAATVTVNVVNDFTAPAVVMTAPANASAVSSASVIVSADATDDVGVIGVQFLLDGAPLGAEVPTAPYFINWNAATVPAGVHTLTARARDAAGRQTTTAAVSVTKTIVSPVITWAAPLNIVYGTALGPQLNATTSVAGTFVYVPPAGTVLRAGIRTLSTTFAPTDTLNYATATASVSITVTDTTPPTLTVPPNATFEATSPAGVTYAFSFSASDPVDGTLPAICVPSGASPFPLGSTLVRCTATDSSSLATVATFTVTVIDTTPPAVTAPASISVAATEYGGARGNVAGSAGSQLLNLFLLGATVVDVADFAPVRLAPQAIISGSPADVTATTLFPPGPTPITFRFRDASGNPGTASSTVTVTARKADEPTVINAVGTGGGRLRALQNPDGGWPFRVGAGCAAAFGTCPNTFGIIGLGLLAADRHTGAMLLRPAAIAAGNALITRYQTAIAQTLPQLPFNQDIEFLVELSSLTGNPDYATTARAWFQVAMNRFPNAAARIDDFVARRNPGRLRSVAAWDAASFIRAAKAAGELDYAVAAAVRTRELEPIWKDTDPAHRTNGPPDNPQAFKYTILGEGSLLWAIHDLPGFDAQVSEYRAFLLAQQDPAGSWDGGDSQVSAYVTIGLAAVGGADAAITAAANFFLAQQLPTGGWPFSASSSTEYSAVNAEVVRAMSTLFSTRAGANVAVAPAQLSNVTFSTVTTSGVTTVVAIEQATAPNVTGGFDVIGGLTYQVNTTAAISGDIIVCFNVPWVTEATAFAAVRILHGESGVLVDRTILAPDQPAPDFASRRVCARTTSLSPFAVALVRPDATPPVLTLPADVTIEATGPLGAAHPFAASATDDVDGAITATCAPASGATFALGATTVTCGAVDAAGNAATPMTFTVRVADTTPPVVTVPANVTIYRAPVTYTFTASANDAVDGSLVPVCTSPSGTRFAKGTTMVTCRATDARGNVGAASFTVTVKAGRNTEDNRKHGSHAAR